MKKRQMRELISATQAVLTTWLNLRREKDPFYILKTHQEELRMREDAERERVDRAKEEAREECTRKWHLQELAVAERTAQFIAHEREVLKLQLQIQQLEKELAAKATP